MHRNKSVDVHQFAMVPRSEIPRSKFKRQFTHKTTFNSGYLIPVFIDEVLPGDMVNLHGTFFARMSTPVFPVMDNMYMDSFYFFIPNRLLQTNWKKLMGEQVNPGDSISFSAPYSDSPNGGYAVCSLQDYMGLPTVGQVGGGAHFRHNTYFLRGYNLVWNTWFRDENLQNSVVVDLDDGPDDPADYVLLRRGKRHDYFTSCVPWMQKGTSVTLPLGSTAPVITNNQDVLVKTSNDTGVAYPFYVKADTTLHFVQSETGGSGTGANLRFATESGLVADLSAATAATINQIRQSFQIQRLLERDARGGTRYQEKVLAHFGVRGDDARLQRPEYLGGGSTPVNISPIAQTSATGLTGGTSPLGGLSAFATTVHNNGFTASFTEHGILIGLVSVRADLTYQQGLHRMWSRYTMYDWYFPVFANLGEQAVLSKELYCDGSANDEDVWGYQEHWGEYRYKPSMITGKFRSTASGTLDAWHLAQKFTTRPTLNTTFIQDTPPVQRVVSAGAQADGQEFIFDAFFDTVIARAMPLYSVPGLVDHF